MKSIYKVILGMWISILSFSVFALDAPTALVPSGLSSGDQFYVMFKSTDNIAGNLTVSEYNNIVNADADAASIGPVDGLTWSALMNHENAAGDTTEQTLSLFDANTTAPVYTTAGGQIAANRDDLFDATIDTVIDFEADGGLGTAGTVWTGSDTAGSAAIPLGDSATSADATDGRSQATNFEWIDNGAYTKTTTTSRIYAVSPLLDVPGPIAVNDAATVTVNNSVDIDVLANDTGVYGVIAASTVALQTQPANGSVNVNAISGLLTYLPNADYVGSDSFTYLVKDINDVDSNIATVSITVTAAASSGGGGGAMGWSLLMLFSVLSLLRAKVRK